MRAGSRDPRPSPACSDPRPGRAGRGSGRSPPRRPSSRGSRTSRPGAPPTRRAPAPTEASPAARMVLERVHETRWSLIVGVVVRLAHDIDAGVTCRREGPRIAPERERLGLGIDDVGRGTFQIHHREVVAAEQPAQPAPCPVVPAGPERRDLRGIEAHVAGAVDHEGASRGPGRWSASRPTAHEARVSTMLTPATIAARNRSTDSRTSRPPSLSKPRPRSSAGCPRRCYPSTVIS